MIGRLGWGPVGNVVLLQEDQGVVDGDGSANGWTGSWDSMGGMTFRFGSERRGMQPTAFDDADDFVGIAG